MRKPDDPGLSLTGSGLVFVATKDGEIRGPSRRGAGVYAWDTRHLSRYEVEPRSGTLRLRSADAVMATAQSVWRSSRTCPTSTRS